MSTYTQYEARHRILCGGLPKRATVDDSLEFDGYETLVRIPEGLKVIGTLRIHNCNSIETLPKGLRVIGTLSIQGCSSLKTLPKDLEVDEDLYIRKCESLILPYGIPEGVKGYVWSDINVLRNNKEHLLNWINTNFSYQLEEKYRKMLSEQ